MVDDLVIGFDADDTLWHNENIFEASHERYRALLAGYHEAAEVDRVLYKTEMRNLKLYGYGIKGFTLSAIETAIELSEGRITAAEIGQLLALGREMLDHPVELLDGAREVLRELAPRHRLVLLTKGDLRDQQRKVRKSGLAEAFSAVEVMAEKDEAAYRAIFARHAIEPGRFVMVGNSVKSDILPVLALGGAGLHVPYRITWAAEHAEPPPADAGGRFLKLDSLREVPAAIARVSGDGRELPPG